MKGRIKPHEGYTEDALNTIIEAKKKENARAIISEYAPAWHTPFTFAAGLGASMVDPLNIATAFIPVVGEARMMNILANAGGIGGRALARAAEGAAAGAVGALALEPVIHSGQRAIQADYDMTSSLLNVGFGAVMGAALKSGFGAIGDWRRLRKGQAHPWEYVPRGEESEAYRAQMASEAEQAYLLTDAGKADPAAAKRVGENAAALYDAFTRHRAYLEQRPIGEVYADYEITWTSQGLEFHGTDGRRFDADGNPLPQYTLLNDSDVMRVDGDGNMVRPDGSVDYTGWRDAELVDYYRQQGFDERAIAEFVPSRLRDLPGELAWRNPDLVDYYRGQGFNDSEIAEFLQPMRQARELAPEQIYQSKIARDALNGRERLALEAEEWTRKVDEIAAAGVPPSSEIRMLSQTPLVMQMLDIDPQAGRKAAKNGIYASPHLFDNTHPNISAKELRQLPAALADPIAIFESTSRSGDLVFMTQIQDAYGATIVVPVALKMKQGSRKLPFNRAKSAYAKNYEVILADNAGATSFPNDEWFLKQVKKNARYINGQKLREWASAAGVQFPIGVQRPATNSRGFRIFTETDLVNLREQNPSLYQSAPEETPPAASQGVQGNSTTIMGNNVSDAAHYEVRELADIIPSHDPQNQFARRPDYPREAQERPYHSDRGEQDKVRGNAKKYQHDYVLNTDPTAGNGPPIITRNGIVLGGNSRAMTLDLVYSQNPEAAAAYRQALFERASMFGLDAAAISGMERPVLARVVDNDMDIATMARKSREYNQTTTQRLQADAEAVSRGRFFSRESLARIAAGIESNDSLARYLNTAESAGLVQNLVKDGVILETEYSSLTKGNGILNDHGKRLVQSALRGVIVADYDVLSNLPAKIAEKLDRSVSAVARMKAKGEKWDLSGKITDALRLINEADKNKVDMEVWFAQTDMVPHLKDDPRLQALALTFRNADAREIKTRMEIYATEAEKSADNQASLFGAPPAHTPKTAFRTAFYKPCASVDGMNVPEFRPEKNDLARALQWVKDNSPKNTRTMTASRAQERIEKKIHDGKLTAEEKSELMKHLRELACFVGRIDIYEPKLGDFFGGVTREAPPRLSEPKSEPAKPAAKTAETEPSVQAGEQPAAEVAAKPDESLEPADAAGPELEPELPARQTELQSEMVEGSRARVIFPGLRRAQIEFFRSADPSSAPHELFHIIRRQWQQMAENPEATPQMRKEWQKMLDFVGAREGEVWSKQMEEKFAQAGERYLWEGICPNPHLRPFMEDMKQRFQEIYADAEAAGLNISDGMRKAFDDMLTVPVATGEIKLRQAIGDIQSRPWERYYYDPDSPTAAETGRTPYGNDIGADVRGAQDVVDAGQQELAPLIESLEQSGLDENLQIAREVRSMIAEADADISRTRIFSELVQEFMACKATLGG